MLTFWQDTVHPRGDIGSLSCQTQSVLQDLFFGRNVCVFSYIFSCFFVTIFSNSTRSVDHSFRANILKLDMYTHERNSVRRTKFRRSRSKTFVMIALSRAS